MTPTELAHLWSVLDASQAQLEKLLGSREIIIAVDLRPDILDQIQHASERDRTKREAADRGRTLPQNTIERPLPNVT